MSPRSTMRSIAILLVAVLAVSAGAQNVRAVKSGTWLGCKDKDTKNELTDYLVDNDRVAVERAAMGYMLEGRCTIFKTGERVFVVDAALFSGLVKIRREGEYVSYWTNYEAI